jgi:hypothetical protein
MKYWRTKDSKKAYYYSSNYFGNDSTKLANYQVLFENKHQVDIYVSPNGNDNGIGDFEHPVHTLETARNIVRLIKRNNVNRKKKYSVILSEGIYPITTTFVLNAEDSGTADSPIIYKGEEGKNIVLFGGKYLSAYSISKASDNLSDCSRLNADTKAKIRIINLKQLGITDYGRLHHGGIYQSNPTSLELFINDTAMKLARWPNEAYAEIDSVIDSVTFQLNNERMKRWEGERDMWVKGFWNNGWADYNFPIKDIEVKNNKIHLGGFSEVKSHRLRKGKRNYQWYIYNALSELDTTGEYYLDKKSGWLYFIPPTEFSDNNRRVSISIFGNEAQPLIKIDSAAYIRFENITLSDTRASGININQSNHIEIDNCKIKNTGTHAISLNGTNCLLSHLTIFNTGSFGISITGGDRKNLTRGNNIVENCIIHDLGRINYTYTSYGVTLNGVGNTVRNCEIYKLPHTAIFFQGNYHLIEKNKIHDVCYEVDDAGAIYCGRDWALHGNTVRYNFIYNLKGSKYVKRYKGLHAIYLDDCASGINVYGNVLYNIGCAGVLNGGGRDNIIENNIFVQCRWAHAADRRANLQHHNKKMYEKLEELNYKNPPWSDSFPNLAKMSKWKTQLYEMIELEKIEIGLKKHFNYNLGIKYNSDWNPQGCVFKNNVIWKNRDEKYLKDTRTSKSQKHGPFRFYTIENNLIEVDPLFENTDNLNFNLSDNSSAYNLPGFVRIPFEEIGVINPKKLLK